ncbi:MAG: TetR/AcrR family transcriptional regulator [Deltaproteobacteria bacterium]
MNVLSERGGRTRARIVEAARELFHSNGVRATSIDQILEASGTGKSQFYHYFGSKEDIVHEVLRFYLEIIQSGRAPVNVNIESWNDLERFFYDHIDGIRVFDCRRSCPIGSIGNELASDNEDIRRDVKLVFDYMRDKIALFFENMKAEGEIKKTSDPESMADFCIATVQGALLLAKVNRDSNAAENAVAHAVQYLKSYSE